ncbi:DUF5753 domain-containing protein [Actinoplanes sp. NPDC051851]|uniref:DUF5753 domain-containing protein n=1 Tax=Actinoplanes sp. NPDC051851 TaxID=3154753 RepID=UPI0034464585
MTADDDAGAAYARRRLGRLLTELRENARDESGDRVAVTVEAAAAHIERARPTLYRMEHGLPGVKIKDRDLRDLCELYRASREDLDTLLALAKVTRVRGWFHPFSDVLPPGFDIYVGLEGAAARITAYEESRVHGLVQTKEYARELLLFPGLDGHERDPAEIDRRVEVRLKRQGILTRSDPAPTRVELLLGETALQRPVGGRAVMARQLNYINELGDLPNVTIRVIPLAAGLHQGVATGPFSMLRFADNTEPPTAYFDGFLGHSLLNKPELVDRLDGVISGIRSCALDEQPSRELIHRVAKEHSSV